MAQVGVQAPANLMEMFSSPSPMLWGIASQQVNDQTLGNLINRQQAQQALDFERQEQPLKMSRMGLENRGLEADLPGRQATSTLKQNEATISSNTMPEQHKAAISKLAKETSDNDYAAFENGVHMMRANPDPRIRKQGEMLFPYLKAIAAERDKIAMQGNQRVREIGATAEGQKALMQMQIDAGRFKDKNARGSQDALEKALVSGSWDKAATAYDAMAQRAAASGDEENAQYYAAKAKEYADKYILARNQEKPGAPNLKDMGIRTNEQPTTQPPALPGQAPEQGTTPVDITPQAIQRAFGQYEPKKYQYRINPTTGKIQRKPL